MNKKAIGTGTIILSSVLVILLVVILIIMGVVLFGGEEKPEKKEIPKALEDADIIITLPEPIIIEEEEEEEEVVEVLLPVTQVEDPVLPGDGNIEDLPDYGRCEANWPDGLGGEFQGIFIGDIAKGECSKIIVQQECEVLDIYDQVTGAFTVPDGIPDCLWT